MVDSCPMVEASAALELIEEMELLEEQHRLRLAAMKLPIDQLTDQPELAMIRALGEFFPNVPEEIMSRIVPCMEVDGGTLPWNRRRRRKVEKAEKVVIHLFAGANEKEWMEALDGNGVAALCADTAIDPGQDLTYEKEMVHGDAVLWLRMLTLYVVAQVSSKQKVMFVKEQPQDPLPVSPMSRC